MRKATLLSAILLAASAVLGQTARNEVYPMSQTRPILLTKDNWAAFHAQFPLPTGSQLKSELNGGHMGLITPERNSKARDFNRVQIGEFHAIMWLDGSAMYEFDWFHTFPIVECPGPLCQYYTPPLQFENITVDVKGTTASSGPIDETGILGIAWFDTPAWGPPVLDNCQPLTFEGDGTYRGYNIITEKTSCIDVALQLTFPTSPYMFTLLDGESFTTYGIANNFILPALGNAGLYSFCLAPPYENFCGGPNVPVYAYRYPSGK